MRRLRRPLLALLVLVAAALIGYAVRAVGGNPGPSSSVSPPTPTPAVSHT